jgi:crotonobetainyl-CoA:carnitine CoA-transferase CaiB-like acyl-CoA transferase
MAQASPTQTPSVKTSDESDCVKSAPRNQAKPMTTISAPMRFSGRRAQPTRPPPMNDQPTKT